MDMIVLQNVVGRITHGLIGFDLAAQGKDGSKFLADFLSLEDPVLEAALNFISINVGFVPAGSEYPSEEKEALKEAIDHARAIARKGDKIDSEEARDAMFDLYGKMGFLYRGFNTEKVSIVQQ
jgi:hypothetical protein